MNRRHFKLLDRLPELAAALRNSSAVLAGELAAHAHLAAATGSSPGEPPRYGALPPSRAEVLLPPGAPAITDTVASAGPVAEALRDRLALVATTVVLVDGTELPILCREAVLAELLARGGLSIGLAGTLVRLANDPPIDVDEVRDILKAARLGERFQPLLELLDVA